MEFIGRVYKLRNKLALKFLELAEKYPNDPIALDALIAGRLAGEHHALAGRTRGQGRRRAPGPSSSSQRDHIRSDKLGPLCQRISYGFCKEYETFLRAVLEKNPHQEVQATGLPVAGPLPEQPPAAARPVSGSSRNWPRSSRACSARSTSRSCCGRTAPRPSGRSRPSSSRPPRSTAT